MHWGLVRAKRLSDNLEQSEVHAKTNKTKDTQEELGGASTKSPPKLKQTRYTNQCVVGQTQNPVKSPISKRPS